MNPSNQPSPTFRVLNKDVDGPLEILIYDIIGEDPWEGTGFTTKDFAGAIKDVNRDRALNIRVNSRGGEVNEGIAMYNRIREWTGPTVAIVDGSAASIASVVIMGAKEIRMPKSAELMIHDAWGMALGNSDDLRGAATRLDEASNRIAGIYAARTGRPITQMRDYMRATTVFSGTSAKEVGLCDVVTDVAPVYNLTTDDISRFRRLPAADPKTKPDSLRGASANQHAHTDMNRTQMIALLREHGAQVADDATDEQLFALITTELNKKTAADKTLPAPNPRSDPTRDLRNAVTALQSAYDRERRNRIAREVDQLIIDEKITAPMRDEVIAQAVADEGVLDTYRKLPPKPPGAEPLAQIGNVDAAASNKDVITVLARCNEPIRAWQRGVNVEMRTIAQASVERGSRIKQFAQRLMAIWNTNTIDATLKQDVILQDIIVDFVRRLLPLRAFASVFQNVPLVGNKTVQVPFYDLDTSASTAFVAANGYNTIGNTTTDNRPIIVGLGATNGGRYYQALSFTSEELNFQPYFNIAQLARLKAQKLASDIVADTLSVITNANYGAAAITKAAALFTSDDIADLRYACRTWPDVGRSLMLDSQYDASLLKDESIKSALQYGGSEAIRQGRIPQIFGFDYYENPNIPANAENLKGFAAFQSAILFACAPVPPMEEVRRNGTTYQLVVDPQSGCAFEYRAFGDNTLDTAYNIIECSYGWAKGNANALKRIVSA